MRPLYSILALIAVLVLAASAPACNVALGASYGYSSAYSLVVPGVSQFQTYGYYAPPPVATGFIASYQAPVQTYYQAPPPQPLPSYYTAPALPLSYGASFYGSYGVPFVRERFRFSDPYFRGDFGAFRGNFFDARFDPFVRQRFFGGVNVRAPFVRLRVF